MTTNGFRLLLGVLLSPVVSAAIIFGISMVIVKSVVPASVETGSLMVAENIATMISVYAGPSIILSCPITLGLVLPLHQLFLSRGQTGLARYLIVGAALGCFAAFLVVLVVRTLGFGTLPVAGSLTAGGAIGIANALIFWLLVVWRSGR